MVHTFESVLHDSGKQWIVELAYDFNDQESIEDARRVTMESIDQNWKPVMVVPVCAGKNPEPVLINPLDTVKTSAEKFINYREALRIYVDKLFDKAITTNVIDASEIEKVRELFWEVEMRQQTIFELVRKSFFQKLQDSYSKETKEEIEQISERIIESDSYLSSNLLNPNYS